MKAFGYSTEEPPASAPIPLREVTVVASAPHLRRLARHLEAAAAAVETGEGFGHLHLRDEWPEWYQDYFDLIVVEP